MSQIIGVVIQDKKVIGYFEYNGTMGVIDGHKIRNTYEEAWAHLRKSEDKACQCGGPQEQAFLALHPPDKPQVHICRQLGARD